MKLQFSIVYCYRDRDIIRVQRSLESLVRQRSLNFEVIFVDYGSDEAHASAVKELTSKYSFVKYIFNNARGMPWNRAHALNSGIALTITDFVFTADVDLIFSENFSDIIEEIKSFDEAIFFSVYLTDATFSDWNKIDKYTGFVKSGDQGLGISLIPKSFLIRSGGYDEFFSFWGYEDNELYWRLNKLNLSARFYNDTIIAYHQWHPNYYKDEKLFPKGWRNFMRDYAETKKTSSTLDVVLKGVLYTNDDRKALKLLLSEDTSYQTIKESLPFLHFSIGQSIEALKSQEYLCLRYRATDYSVYRSSKAIQLLIAINKRLKKISWVPYELASKYSDLNVSVYQMRDMLMYLIYDKRHLLEDYALIISDDETQLRIVILKR